MIGVDNIVKEFNVKDLDAYINANAQNAELKYKSYFPTLYTPLLTFESINATASLIVAASIVGFDSKAPRKGRPAVQKLAGDIPKLDIARSKTETDLNVYRMLLYAISSATAANNPAGAVAAKNRMVEWMYEDSTFTINGVNGRLELMAKMVASTGEYTVTPANNPGGTTTPMTVKFGIPGGNIANSGTNWWANAATSKPITDLKAKVAAARTQGINLKYATMDQLTFDQMILSDEIIKYAAGYLNNLTALQGLQVITVESINSLLNKMNLPQIRIWDSYVNIEDQAGNQTSTSGWTLGNVTLSESPTFGNTQHTTPGEAFVEAGVSKAVTQFSEFIMCKSWATEDAIEVVTKATAYATPVLNSPDRIFILKTKQS